MDYSMPGADADSDLPENERNRISSRNVFFQVMVISTWIWLAAEFNFGEGPWWGTLEIVTALFSSAFFATITHVLCAFVLGAC